MLAVLAVCVLAVTETELEAKFIEFQHKYNRQYSTKEEYDHRFETFKKNLKIAAYHQSKNPKATFGVTKFSDWTREELKSLRGSKLPESETKTTVKKFANALRSGGIQVSTNPTNFDWGSAGILTPVYNQGQCGSCWAFSATETMESYWALAGNQLVSLSMEQVVDCDTTCYGCGGGWPYLAYQYIQGAPGQDLYSEYPYTAGNGQAGNCQFIPSDAVASNDGYVNINGETGIYSQLSSQNGGPVSVCVDASSWDSYTGGILTSCGNNVDHCVQATGYYNYGSSNAYWNVRNSWGADWGENGYIWILIGQDLCDIGDYATVVNVTSPSPRM